MEQGRRRDLGSCSGAIKLGSETMNNIGVKGDAAAHLLDRECGAKKK